MDSAPSTLGDFLRWARERAELTQRDIAALLDVSPSTVARWETGGRGISQEQARRLWGLLNLTAAERVMVTTLPGAR